MEFLVVISVFIAAAAIVALISARRREQATALTLRSVRKALGVRAGEEDTVRVAKDLSERAEEAAIQSTTYVEALDGSSVGVAVLTSSGAVAYANHVALALLDGEGERAVLRTRASALARRVDESGQAESIEVDVHEPERRVLVLNAVPMAGTRSLGSVCLYLEDLSEQRRLDAMRTDFVSNASHELKTPLGALSLLAETLADVEDDEMKARLASRLRVEAGRMANVVDDILQLAETESLGTEYALVSISDLVEQAADGLEEAADDRSVDVIAGSLEDAIVFADKEQVVSAIRNLLINAIAYTGTVEEPGSVTYRSVVEADMVTVEVADSGIGIPERYQDRVFERFFRVDRARSRESGGTGLGLSIVKNVALAHGGSVGLESQVGVGSTFTFSLPIAEGTTEGAEA